MQDSLLAFPRVSNSRRWSIDRLLFYNPGGLPCGSPPVCKLAAVRARFPRGVGSDSGTKKRSVEYSTGRYVGMWDMLFRIFQCCDWEGIKTLFYIEFSFLYLKELDGCIREV